MMVKIFFLMVAFVGIAQPKAFMPSLERVKKRVEQASFDGKSMTLNDWLNLKKISLTQGTVPASIALDEIEKKIEALYWCKQTDLLQSVRQVPPSQSITAAHMILDSIKQRYHGERLAIITFVRDLSIEEQQLHELSHALIKQLSNKGDEAIFKKTKVLFNSVQTHFLQTLRTLTEMANTLLMNQG